MVGDGGGRQLLYIHPELRIRVDIDPGSDYREKKNGAGSDTNEKIRSKSDKKSSHLSLNIDYFVKISVKMFKHQYLLKKNQRKKQKTLKKKSDPDPTKKNSYLSLNIDYFVQISVKMFKHQYLYKKSA